MPKGKFHPYDFNNKQFIIPTGFEEKGGWDLRCYDHLTGIFFIFYLMNRSKNAYCYSNGNIKECFSINTIYDFILENGNNDENYRYSFPYFYNNGVLGLKYGSLKINASTNEISMYYCGNMNYHQRKSFSKVYFDKDSFFYYFSCNSVSDFISGYSNSIINFSSFPTISNTDSSLSPFNFIDEVSIKEMGLIAGTKYVYYKIYNINRDKHYHGILDIKLNKILYNFDEDIISFKPISDNEMLAITKTSAYKICIIKSGNNCIDVCTSGNLILNTEGNKCQSDCDSGQIK